MVKILAVDDDETEMKLLTANLEGHGYTVIPVYDIQHAKDAIAKGGIDLVVSDYGVGTEGSLLTKLVSKPVDRTGVQLAEWIRREHNGIPSVILHTTVPEHVVDKYKSPELLQSNIISAHVSKGCYTELQTAISSALTQHSGEDQSPATHEAPSVHADRSQVHPQAQVAHANIHHLVQTAPSKIEYEI